MLKSIQVHVHFDPLDPLNPNIPSIQSNYLFLIILNKDKATYVSKLFILFCILFLACIPQAKAYVRILCLYLGHNSGICVNPEVEEDHLGAGESSEFKALGKSPLQNSS